MQRDLAAVSAEADEDKGARFELGAGRQMEAPDQHARGGGEGIEEAQIDIGGAEGCLVAGDQALVHPVVAHADEHLDAARLEVSGAGIDGLDLQRDVHVLAVGAGDDDGRLRAADAGGEQHLRFFASP